MSCLWSAQLILLKSHIGEKRQLHLLIPKIVIGTYVEAFTVL